MNLGLGNLATLKAFVLAEAVAGDTTYDARLATIGKSAAALVEGYCNRVFAYAAGDTFHFYGGRSRIVLPRFPLVTVTAIEEQTSAGGAWTSLGSVASILYSTDDLSGIIDFGAALGGEVSRFRLTYTGGYFFETLEPTDGSYPTSQPSGSTALPEDLRLAWLLQSQRLFERSREVSVRALKSKERPELPALIAEDITAILDSFRRYTT
jgi:hypothetical protein